MIVANDLRVIDLDVETSRYGKDDAGHPVYVWRESADNRYGLSRPLYCCITASDKELYFTFYNPSGNVQLTSAWKAAATAAGAIMIIFVVTMITDRFRDAPMPYSTEPPPGMALIASVGTAIILGVIVFYIWDSIATVLRWRRDRFAGDGGITIVPWSLLEAFQVVTPEEAGVKRDPEKRSGGGHGLLATFGNEHPAIPLTANIWDYQSIADKHRDLTTLFIDSRETSFARWKKRNAGPASPPSSGNPGPTLKL
jgi:hypothetical protein